MAKQAVSFAADFFKVLPQKLHAAIRNGELKTYENEKGKRVVEMDEVKAYLAGAPTRAGRPAKKEEDALVRGLRTGDMFVRTTHHEVIRHAHLITGEMEENYTLRSSSDPQGFKDAWKKESIKDILDHDKGFIIDRWSFLELIAQSFDLTNESEVGLQIRAIAEAEKANSDEKKAKMVEERLERERFAEQEARMIAEHKNKAG